jgi:hypothetical protein
MNIMSSVSLINTDYNRRGRDIYTANATMRDIANVMEHPLFSEFVGKYFADPFDAASMICMLQAYDKLSRAKIQGKKIEPYEKVAILYDAMSNKETRERILFGDAIKQIDSA